MSEKISVAVLLVIALAGGLFLWSRAKSVPSAAPGYLNTSYTIEGTPVTLADGVAKTSSAPGSASKTTTRFFGNVALGDLNGDGTPDAAFLLTQDSGGSGTFYYAVAALKTDSGYEGTNAILLGDRIAPQTTEIHGGEIVVNYADRAAGEPMTAQPSVGVSKYFTVSGTTLAEAPHPAGAGEHCGGNMTNAPVCASGFHCAPVPGSHLPFGDVGGTCVAN